MLTIFIRTLLIYFLLVGAMRLMGKRQIGELEVSELVTTLLLSEIATLPIENRDIPLMYAVVPILTLLTLEVTASVLLTHVPKLKDLLSARPSVLIRKGELDQKELSRMRISLEELLSELRQQNVTDPEDVYYAILEKNGKMTVIPKDAASPLTIRRASLPEQEDGMMHILVSNGVMNHHGLCAVGKTPEDVMELLEEYHATPEETFYLLENDRGKIQFMRKETPKK